MQKHTITNCTVKRKNNSTETCYYSIITVGVIKTDVLKYLKENNCITFFGKKIMAWTVIHSE